MKRQRPKLRVKDEQLSAAANHAAKVSRLQTLIRSSNRHGNSSNTGVLSFSHLAFWASIASLAFVAFLWLGARTPARQLEQETASGRETFQPTESTLGDQAPSEEPGPDKPADSSSTQRELDGAGEISDVTATIDAGEGDDSTQTQFSDIAAKSRRRFQDEARGGDRSVAVTLKVDPAASEEARISLGEQIDAALPVLGSYLDLEAPLTIIALEETSWAVETVRATSGFSDQFSEDVVESIRTDGLERSSEDCGGISGFAQTDFENAVVVIDAGASCNWRPGPFIDDSESIVAHELTHVVQYSLTGMCAEVPAWFVEGQAQFVGWNLAVANGQSLYEDSRRFSINPAELSVPVDLEDLNSPTSDGAEYRIGALAVEVLIADYGWDMTTDLLASLDRKTVGCGSPDPEFSKFHRAFTAITGLQPIEFNERVNKYVAWIVAN